MKSKLIIIVPIILLIITISFLISQHNKSKQKVVELFQSEQLTDSRQLSREIRSYLKDRTQEVNALLSLPSIQNRKMNDLVTDVQAFFASEKNNHVKAVSIIDENGKIVYSTNNKEIRRNFKEFNFFKWASKLENKGKEYLSTLLKNKGDSKENESGFHIFLIVPIYQNIGNKQNPIANNRFLGLVALKINLNEVVSELLPIVCPDSSNVHVFILDRNGSLLFHSTHPEMILNNIYKQDKNCFTCHKNFNYVDKILSSKEGNIDYNLRGGPNEIASYSSMKTMNVSWKIVISEPYGQITGFINYDLEMTLILIGMITFLFGLGSLLLIHNNRLKIIAEEESKQWKEKDELNKKLHESQEHYKTVVDNSPDAIIIHCEGKLVFASPSTLELLGASNYEEIMGKSIYEFVHPEDHELARKRLSEGLTNDNALPIVEIRYIKIDRSIINVEAVSKQTTFNGKPALQTIVHDVTARKRAELESQVLHEITEGVVTTSNLDELLVLIHNALKKVTYADNLFIALHDDKTGLFSFPYFVDKFDSAPLPAEIKKSCTAYVFKTGKPLLLTKQLFKQLIEQKEVESVGSDSPSWLGVPLQAPSRKIGVLVIQNYEHENFYSEGDVNLLSTIGNQIATIIERRRTEEEIMEQNKKLIKLNAEKDKFFSIIAHDLKSPFQGFLNLTEVMSENAEEFSMSELAAFSRSINITAKNFYKLLEDLLEWAQVQKGSIEFSPIEINLFKIVSQSINTIYQRADQKGIKIVNDIDVKQEIIADERMVGTIIRNLLSNAVKYTNPEGKIIINSEIHEKDFIQVSVKDNGMGITEGDLDRLFKIEEKISRKGTEKEEGTGLGLLLCKEFVELHGGKIWVESKEGIGSTFYFTLPLVK